MTYTRLLSSALLVGLFCLAFPFAGSHAATYTAQEQANMKLVADFYAELDAAGPALKQKIRGIAEKYLQPDYIQHMEQQGAFGPGREGFIRMLDQVPAGPLPPAKLLVLTAQGDLVVQVTSRSMPGGKDAYIFNMFRVQDGKLAEHWDAMSGASMMGRASGSPQDTAR